MEGELPRLKPLSFGLALSLSFQQPSAAATAAAVNAAAPDGPACQRATKLSLTATI